MRIIICIVSAFLLILFFPGCSSDEKGQIESKITNEEILQRFNTQANPGKWKDLKEGHVPIYSIKKTKKEITITAQAPFKSTPEHYTEAIVLLDVGFKEMMKKSFAKYEEYPATVFVLPADAKGEFYLVLKCNIHDMWLEHLIIK